MSLTPFSVALFLALAALVLVLALGVRDSLREGAPRNRSQGFMRLRVLLQAIAIAAAMAALWFAGR